MKFDSREIRGNRDVICLSLLKAGGRRPVGSPNTPKELSAPAAAWRQVAADKKPVWPPFVGACQIAEPTSFAAVGDLGRGHRRSPF